MNKRIATVVITLLFAGPLVAVAETVVQQNSQVMTAYAQLAVLLKKIADYRISAAPIVSYTPDHGKAPLTVTFTINQNKADGTESIIFVHAVAICLYIASLRDSNFVVVSGATSTHRWCGGNGFE